MCIGWGTDEKAIIRVLGKRNESQRKKIRESYREIYGKDLIDALSSELSGHFLVHYSHFKKILKSQNILIREI